MITLSDATGNEGGNAMTILNASNLRKYYGENESLVKALDEFAFEEGVLRFNVFKNYGREGETAYPFEFPFGQLTLNGYVIAGVLFAKDKKGKKVIEFIKT